MDTALQADFATGRKQGLDIQQIRADFPMLQHERNGKQLIYFDTAATNQKPQVVIDRLNKLYTAEYAKPQEQHELSRKMTKEFEETRKKVAQFINASTEKEIIFTKNTTKGINIVAQGFGRALLEEDDQILITALEHQANIVPWQIACELSGAKIVVVPVTATGEVELSAIEASINDRTRIISISYSSNVLGTILPVKEIAQMAHSRGIPILVDAAQTAPHMPVNVQEMDCDYLVFSAHKMGGPAGVGVLYGKAEWLDRIPSHNGGSENAKHSTFEATEYLEIPKKFEAGTQAFEQVAAFGTLIDYVTGLGMEMTSEYERELLAYATEKLSAIPQITIYGTAAEKEPVLSFLIEGTEVGEVEKYLSDEHNIDLRAGKLSAQPLIEYLGVEGLVRASFCYYNTRDEIDTFVVAIQKFLTTYN